MFVVLFEVRPHEEQWDEYLGIAALLRPELEGIDGFIDNTRYRSAVDPRRVLSLSTWRDEKSLIRWRTQSTHHAQGQRPGRDEVFADYRLRVAEVTSDTRGAAGAPLPQSRFDETEVGDAKAVTVVEARDGDALPELAGSAGLRDHERFDGVLPPHAPLLLASWADLDAAECAVPSSSDVRVRHARVIRDYGLRDRREAPQYFPPPTRRV